MPLINYSANRLEALGSQGQFGIRRGTLPNITASVSSSCVNYEDTGFISMSNITGGRGPIYQYSLYDVSASAFITQSTANTSATISNLSNSTYSLNISNEGVFAYTQSITISCPPPPNLEVQYLVVGGGSAGRGSGTGGSGGGVVSGSLSIPYRTTLINIVGNGGTSVNGVPTITAGSSSISSSAVGFFGAGGADSTKSGGPQYNDQGLGTPFSSGGGAGSSENGTNGTQFVNGNGGDGSIWLNGVYYAGGGGGTGGSPNPVVLGDAGLGGGGYGSGSLANGVNGLGGGASGAGNKGGSGVVIIRYSTGSVRPAFGGTITEAGGYYYHTFTGSGEFRYAKS